MRIHPGKISGIVLGDPVPPSARLPHYTPKVFFLVIPAKAGIQTITCLESYSSAHRENQGKERNRKAFYQLSKCATPKSREV